MGLINVYDKEQMLLMELEFNKGAQSRQAEIDELQKKYDELNNRATGIALDQMTTAKLNYELQGRIDATEKWIEANKKTIALSEWHGYTTEEYVDADDLLDILKGNKDEN